MPVVQVRAATHYACAPARGRDNHLHGERAARVSEVGPQRRGAPPSAQTGLLHALREIVQASSTREARRRASALRRTLQARGEDTHPLDELLEGMLARVRECERLKRIAGSDELTRIANRRAFNDALRRELSRGAREHRPLALLMFDLDGLKSINDAFGHAAGDQALRAVARCASAIVRHGDLVARIGGDEFAVVLPNTDADKARAVGTRIRRRLREAHACEFPIDVSLGLAVAEGGQQSEGELLRDADADLYRDKLARKTLRPS